MSKDSLSVKLSYITLLADTELIMAFARFDRDSDVYVYATDDGFCCERCPEVGQSFCCKTSAEMVAHLREHLAKGDRVPLDAIEELTTYSPDD